MYATTILFVETGRFLLFGIISFFIIQNGVLIFSLSCLMPFQSRLIFSAIANLTNLLTLTLYSSNFSFQASFEKSTSFSQTILTISLLFV